MEDGYEDPWSISWYSHFKFSQWSLFLLKKSQIYLVKGMQKGEGTYKHKHCDFTLSQAGYQSLLPTVGLLWINTHKSLIAERSCINVETEPRTYCYDGGCGSRGQKTILGVGSQNWGVQHNFLWQSGNFLGGGIVKYFRGRW